MIPTHASQMYAKNVETFLRHLLEKWQINLDREDEIIAGTLVTRGGEIVHPQVREILELPPLAAPPPAETPEPPGPSEPTESSEPAEGDE
jgi:NAD(P) transhydrogenase subunit alpha